MTEKLTFPGWLQTRGLRPETAQAVVTELDIKSHDALKACTTSVLLKADLLSRAKVKFPFAVYAEFHRFMEYSVEPQLLQPPGCSLVHIFCSMLEPVSLELSSCAQKLRSLKSSSTHSEDLNGQLLGTNGVRGTENDDDTVNPDSSEDDPEYDPEDDPEDDEDDPEDYPEDDPEDATDIAQNTQKSSVPIQELEISTKQKSRSPTKEKSKTETEASSIDTGDNCAVKIESEQGDIDSPTPESSSCISLKDDPDDATNGNVARSEAEQSGNNFAHKSSTCSKASNKLPLLKKNSPVQETSSHDYRPSSSQHNIKLKRKLFKHKRNVLKRRIPYKCNVCGKAFSTMNILNMHVRTHIGDRPYKCPECDKRYTQLHYLKTHMSTHRRKQSHKCTICGQGFSFLGCFQKHMRSHMKNHPFRGHGTGFGKVMQILYNTSYKL